MQTLAPNSFCPLTNPQPYQRDGDKPRQGVVANTLNLFRNGAVGFIDWLDVWGGIRRSAKYKVSNSAHCSEKKNGESGDVDGRQIRPPLDDLCSRAWI